MPTTTPLVSIIIPTYNRANMVGSAIVSAISQTYPNIEIIVVDDGSSDNTKEIVQAFQNVQYVYQPNGGQASARNRGLKEAKGEYIASLDSDDIWETNFLSYIVPYAEEHQLDFAFANWMQDNGHGVFFDFLTHYFQWETHLFTVQENTEWALFSYEGLRTAYIEGCPSPSSSLVIRRGSMPTVWDPSMNIGDDWCLLLQIIFAKQCRVAFTVRPLWHKNVNCNNIYDSRDTKDVIRLLYIKDLSRIIKYISPKLTKGERNKLIKFHYDKILLYLYQIKKVNSLDDVKEVLFCVFKAIEVYPTKTVIKILSKLSTERFWKHASKFIFKS